MEKKQESRIQPQAGDALVVVDVQNDFLPGGALGVSAGDRVIDPLNRAVLLFHQRGLPIFFSRDWHPTQHCSFKERNGPWPEHCVQNTPGAEFARDIMVPKEAIIISKGVLHDEEQYSTIYGRNSEWEELSRILDRLGIKRIFIGGLATDYCVLNTVLDALKLGFEAYVFTDGICAVNVNPGDEENALKQMTESGGHLITTDRLA